MKDKILEADSEKDCAFQEIKIRDFKEYYAECKSMYSSQNPIWKHDCRKEICPMYQTWKHMQKHLT